jgi:MiaB/RimO family radical SAM methylthiotransferase
MQIVLQEKNGFPEFSLQSSRRARGVVKVQDGCSHRCTYCIIPFTRGPSVSRPFSAILQEVRRVFSSGIPEVVLSGINLGHFGRDLSPRTDFWDLVAFLEQELASEWAGKKRLRLGSLEPGELNSKGLDTLAGSTMLCPHLHVSLQSASPKVLRAMGRGHYSPGSVSGFVLELERLGLDYVLGADLLVGFPGESDADFSDTLKFCTRLPLGYAHVFPYSVRPGTAAAAFSSQVPHAIRSARAGDLRQALLENRMDTLRRIASKRLLTMVPETSSRGICEYYFTCRTEDSSPPLPYGQLVGVRPLRVAGDGADAEIVVQEVSG